jgi:hypothetical protein
MPTSAEVSGFVLVLGLVFGLAWFLGSLVGPSPAPPPSGRSMPGMQVSGAP